MKARGGLSRVSAVVLVAALAGCASVGKESNPQRSSSSVPLSFEERETGAIDLVALIDPENRRMSLPGQVCGMPDTLPRRRDAREQQYVKELSCAISAFGTYYQTYEEFRSSVKGNRPGMAGNDTQSEAAVNSLALAVKRNQIQDRIMLRSDALCTDFQRRLGLQLRVENDTFFSNWLQNSRTRVVGGIGSLFLNSDTVFALTSAARITGTPGYINDEEQLEVTVMQVAARGIDLARQQKREEINERRFFQRTDENPLTGPEMDATFAPLLEKVSLEISDGMPPGDIPSYDEIQKTVGFVNIGAYSLENALADVIDYHSLCGVAAGLNAVADTLTIELE